MRLLTFTRHGVVVVALSSICGISTAELVDTFDIGTGEFTSTALFQFGNENQYLYRYHYDGELTGRDLFDLAAAAQPEFFEYEIKSYEFGDFLVGVSIGDDFDAGFGTPPDYLDYWHYWTMEPDSTEWEMSMIGFGDRILSDGSADGWVFNSDSAPIPAIPTGFALLGMGLQRRRLR